MSIGNLTNLVSLNIGRRKYKNTNSIKEYPQELGALINLKIILLNVTDLSKPIPAAIIGLPNISSTVKESFQQTNKKFLNN